MSPQSPDSNPDHGDTPGGAAAARARSFSGVADAYDRARPSYPPDAVDWLVGIPSARVVELGAGTGKLTEVLVAAGHDVLATDPLPEMLERLRARVPGVPAVLASAEAIPVPSRSVDVVITAQAFHWFDHERALPEIARVLRPGGVLALVWNDRDEGIPWVRKLGNIIGGGPGSGQVTDELVEPARASLYFGFVEPREFRFWQTLRKPDLFDLVRSRSEVALLAEPDREALLSRVGALYDDYGRGPDGMQLPYLTRCFRSTVKDQPPPPVVVQTVARRAAPMDSTTAAAASTEETQPINRAAAHAGNPAQPPEDPGTVLIDFK